MKGIELSKKYYEAFGAPMLRNDFPELEGTIAVGLVGDGSECFGYDDEISRDHDFEPGFCMFVPNDIDSRTEFRLERAYAKLPKTFEGVDRLKISPVGGSRHGVIKTGDFYLGKIGFSGVPQTFEQWLSIPDSGLAAATNGEVFRDDLGEFSKIRAALLSMPEDVRLKKLAGHLIMMAQAGQYNYSRCIDHGETGAAQLAAAEFVNHTIKAVFLLNKTPCPFYKWSFRALRELPKLSQLSDSLEFLISSDNDSATSHIKAEIVEDIAGLVIEELKNQSLTEAVCGDLEKHAYSVNDKISDTALRTMHVMAAV